MIGINVGGCTERMLARINDDVDNFKRSWDASLLVTLSLHCDDLTD